MIVILRKGLRVVEQVVDPLQQHVDVLRVCGPRFNSAFKRTNTLATLFGFAFFSAIAREITKRRTISTRPAQKIQPHTANYTADTLVAPAHCYLPLVLVSPQAVVDCPLRPPCERDASAW